MTSTPGSVPSPNEPVAPTAQLAPDTHPARSAPETYSAQSAPSAPATSSAPAAPSAPEAPPTPAPGARVVGGVWTASTTPEQEEPHGIRPWTLTWGVLLVSVGVITLAIGLGAHINLTTAGISVLAALGVLLLVLALLPQRTRSDSRRA